YDQLGQPDFRRGGGAKAGAVRRGPPDRLQHMRVGVPKDERSPRADIVNVAVAIGVVEVGTLSALDEERLAADGAEGPDGAVDTAGNHSKGLCEQGLRALDLHAVTILSGNIVPDTHCSAAGLLAPLRP